MQTITALKKYGLSEEEAAIYLALLKCIESPVYALARTTRIPRTTVYTALEKLKAQGLVLAFKKNNVLYYTPESPKKLIYLLQEKESLITELLPEMQALIDSSEIKPTVKIYEGKEGVQTVREDIIEVLSRAAHRELLAIANDSFYKILPKYFPHSVERRADLGIQARLILPSSERQNPHYSSLANKKALREVRFLPPRVVHRCSINIYANKIAFFSLKEEEMISVILESPTISDMFKQFFQFNWDILSVKN